MCKAADCHRAVYAREHCERHYRQLLRHGALLPERRAALICSAGGCDRTAVTRGWCHAHYLRWVRTGTPRDSDPLTQAGRPRCSVDGCPNPNHARGLCRTHLARLQTTGDIAEQVAVRTPGSEGWITHGYRGVKVPVELRHLTGGATSTLEHRLVMAVLLDRPLLRHEVVHHRDGNRLNNSPANLELWSTSQPKGQRVADKLSWAWSMIARYDEEAVTTLGLDPFLHARGARAHQ